MNLVYAVGVFLLYLPPLMVFMTQGLIHRYRYLLYPERAIWLTVPLTAFMLVLLPEAWVAWLSYFCIFNIMNYYAYKRLRKPAIAFSLSVYACFAISVLWEWPYQLSYTQNMDAVYMSLFKALGVPFFLLAIYRLGWRPNLFQLSSALLIVGYGVLALLLIEHIGLLLHLYRLPWFFFLLFLVPSKHLNKSTVPKG